MTTESVAPEAVEATTSPDIPAIVRRLRDTFATGRTRSLDWRKQQLCALAKLVEENETAIAAALEQTSAASPSRRGWSIPQLPPARPDTQPNTSASGCVASTDCSSWLNYPAAVGWSTSRTAPC